MSAVVQLLGPAFRDPYADLVLSQLLEPKDALDLTQREFEILMAAIRGEILTSKKIASELSKVVKTTLSELKSARTHLP